MQILSLLAEKKVFEFETCEKTDFFAPKDSGLCATLSAVQNLLILVLVLLILLRRRTNVRNVSKYSLFYGVEFTFLLLNCFFRNTDAA